METFFAVSALSVVILVVILIVELKATQRQVNDLQGNLDARLRQSISAVVVEPLDRLAAVEHRVNGLEVEVMSRLAESASPPEPTTEPPANLPAQA